MSKWITLYEQLRELANGILFTLALTMTVALLSIMIARVKTQGITDRVGQLIHGMIVFKLGLALGFGYRWAVSRCMSSEYVCAPLANEAWVLPLSTVVTVAGGLMILRVLSPLHWRPWSWLAALVVSVSFPFVYYSFDIMFPTEKTWGPIVAGVYSFDRVILSIMIAVFGSYVALDVASRALASTGVMKALWVLGSAVVMGASIWAMHFVAMLAFDLPGVPVSYDLGLTLLSLVMPMIFTCIGFVAASNSRNVLSIAFSGSLIAFGIISMHYVGIAAMEMPAVVTYDLLWVAISVLIAFIASVIAVVLAFVETTPMQKLAAAFVLGILGISGLHYSAMVGFICRRAPDVQEQGIPTIPISMGEDTLTMMVVGIIAILFLVFMLMTSYDRKRQQQRSEPQ